MAKDDGNLPGPAVGGAERPDLNDVDATREYASEIREERLVNEEPDPNQHGPAVTGETSEEGEDE